MVHLEEESANEEKYINGNDPDGFEGITEEFILHLTRAVKDDQQVEKHCYHCDSPNHFIHDCPLLVGTQSGPPFNWMEGMALRKGAKAPPGKVTMPKVSQDGTTQV